MPAPVDQAASTGGGGCGNGRSSAASAASSRLMRMFPRGFGGNVCLWIHRRCQGQFVVDVVEDREQRRTQQQRVGNAEHGRGSSPASAPSAAPCRSRDSRPARPPSAADVGGASSRVSAISARRLSSAGRSSAMKACGAERACRLTSARPSRQRQIRSGSMPMIE